MTRNRSPHGLIALPFAFALLGLLLQAQTPAPRQAQSAGRSGFGAPASLGLSAERLARMRRAIRVMWTRELGGRGDAGGPRRAASGAVGRRPARRERRVPMRTDAPSASPPRRSHHERGCCCCTKRAASCYGPISAIPASSRDRRARSRKGRHRAAARRRRTRDHHPRPAHASVGDQLRLRRQRARRRRLSQGTGDDRTVFAEGSLADT